MTDSLLPNAPSLEEPLEMLEACHERIEAQLRTLERLLDYLPRHGADEQARQAARNVLRYFELAGPNHHEDEERNLFPTLIERAGAEDAAAVRALVADLLAWDWPEGAYDLVVAMFIQFANPAERERIFAGMVQALKPGGRLLLHGYTPKQLEYRTGGPGAVDNLYTPEMLRQAFAGLEIEALREYEAELNEGLAHRGRSALIDLVARKPA